jgi:predicted transcriptional regulator
MFKTSKQATSEKLQVIFERLVKEGLLINKNKSEMLYQVTGKYDYIQHVMQFIIDRENIVIDEGKDEAQKGFVI